MSNQTKSFTRGGQIAFHNLRMWNQINKTVFKMALLCFLLLTVLLAFLITPHEVFSSAYYWCYSKLSPLLSLLEFKPTVFHVVYHGRIYSETSKSFLSQWQFVDNARSIIRYFVIAGVIALILTCVITFFIVRWLTNRGKAQTANQYIRGAQLDDAKVIAKRIRKDRLNSDIEVDGIPIIKESEVQHFLVHGTTGVGKGELIKKMLDAIRARGDRVILYDKGCTFTSLYYRESTDKILNPFDQRCAPWDCWREALEAPDFENMAESLIPMHGETDPFWVNAARTIFASAAYTMQDDSERSIVRLLRLLLTEELQNLEKYLSETEAATLVSDKIEKTAISIRSVLTTYLKSLKYLQGLNPVGQAGFSIREWVKQENNDGWLFISADAEQISALRPLISMWLAMASITLLSLPENYERRIWFIVDELPSLHKLPQLSETIAEVRKFGGCFLLGMQNYAQLEKVYGRNGAREIFDLLNTRFFFRSPSSDMAKLVSQELGEEETESLRENYSYGANRIRDGISIGHQRVIKPIVSYSEIMTLQDLHCYLRLPSHYPVANMQLEWQQRVKRVTGLLRRDIQKDPVIEGHIKQIEGKGNKGFTANKIGENINDEDNSQGSQPRPPTSHYRKRRQQKDIDDLSIEV